MFGKMVGLDLHGECVKAALVQKGLRGIEVLELASRSANGNPVQAARSLIEDKGWQNCDMVLGIASQEVLVRNVCLPFADLSKIQKVIKYEAEPLIPFAIEDLVVDFCATEAEQPGQSEVILLAVKKETLSAKLAALNGVGLRPQCVGFEAFFLWQGFHHLYQERTRGILALVALETDRTVVNIGEQSNLMFTRCLPTVGEGCGHLAAEIQRTCEAFQSHFGGPQVDRIVLCGELSAQPAFVEDLQQKLNAPAETCPQQHTLFLSAIGGAVGWMDRRTRCPDFLQEEFAGGSHLSKSFVWTKLLAAALLLSILTNTFFNLYTKNKQLDHLNHVIRTEFSAMFPHVGKVTNEMLQGQQQMQEAKDRLAEYEAMFGHKNSVLEFFRELSAIVPGDIRLKLLDLVITEAEMRIQAEAPSFQKIEELKRRLSLSPYFREVQIARTKVLNSPAGEGVEFEMTINLRPEVGP
ncbi:MAG: pilus assembly protein PilM [bacterium]